MECQPCASHQVCNEPQQMEPAPDYTNSTGLSPTISSRRRTSCRNSRGLARNSSSRMFSPGITDYFQRMLSISLLLLLVFTSGCQGTSHGCAMTSHIYTALAAGRSFTPIKAELIPKAPVAKGQIEIFTGFVICNCYDVPE